MFQNTRKYSILLIAFLSYISVNAYHPNSTLTDTVDFESTMKIEKYHYDRHINSLFFSGFGGTSLLAGHFELSFLHGSNSFFSNTLGVGLTKTNASLFKLGIFTPNNRFYTLQNVFSVNFGKENHFAELGFGTTWFIGRVREVTHFYPVVAYKFIPLKEKYSTNNYYFRVFSNMNYLLGGRYEFVDSYFGIGFGWGL